MVLHPVKPRESLERRAFIKMVMYLNPDIDYQEAATAYDDYFQPLKDRERFERQKTGHRGHPGPTGAARPAHAHPRHRVSPDRVRAIAAPAATVSSARQRASGSDLSF
jgi:hypothetical protein